MNTRTLQSRFGAEFAILLFGLLLQLMIWGGLDYKIQAERQLERDNAVEATANYTRAFAPIGFTLDELHAIWNCITCPTLLVRGTESWAPDPTLDGRIDHFRNARAVHVEGAGHWVHHDRLEEFLGLVREFFAA